MNFRVAFWQDVMASLAKARGGLRDRRGGRLPPAAGDVRDVCRGLLRTRGEATSVPPETVAFSTALFPKRDVIFWAPDRY